MRSAVLVLLLVTACSADRYGTYFLADGRGAQISFDHAEFYFGNQLDGAFASPSGVHTGDVYERLLNPADVAVPTDHGAKLATYYLAPDGDTNVGSYVMVIARDAGNAIVGVGEASKFPLATAGEVLEIEIPLVAPGQNVQQWGSDPACVMWTRGGGKPVGFVRDNDRDCDDALAAMDCNDLLYCRAGDPQCSNTPVVCDTPCSLGCMAAGVCVPSACVFSDVCNAGETCASKPTPAEILTCFAVNGGPPHLDVRLPTSTINNHPDQPCVHTFAIPLPNSARCSNPAILYQEPFPDGYSLSVSDGGTSCKFDLKLPQNQAPFVGDHHFLVAIDPPTGVIGRSTFFFGINPLSSPTCSTTVSTENALLIDSCP